MTLKQFMGWGACTMLAVGISMYFNFGFLACVAIGFCAAMIGIMIGSE